LTPLIKYFLLGLTLFSNHITASGQESKLESKSHFYLKTVESADSLYNVKDYIRSAQIYEQAAFIALENQIKSTNYYNAACAWSLAGDRENAFKNLNKAFDLGGTVFRDFQNDKDLYTLHKEKEWDKLIEKVQAKFDDRQRFYLWGAYFGILFILFFYNLFLFFSLKETSFLYYSLFIFLWANLEIGRSYEFGEYLYKIFFYLKYLNPASGQRVFIPSLVTVFYLLFVRSFLSLDERILKLDKWVKGIIGFYIFITIVSYFFHFLNGTIVDPTFILAYLFTFIVSIYCWNKGYRAARFFVVGNIFFIIGISWTILSLFGISFLPKYISVFHPDNIGSVVFMTLLSFALGDKMNILKIEKAQAQEKALEVLEQRVQERTSEVVRQKHIIEEKNKDITDSITYAERIQQAKLPKKEDIYLVLPNSFILFKPKDIVSGDFYFFHKKDQLIYIAAADCTGHGVPGAFMSMIGSEKLEDVVLQNTDLSEMLKQLNRGIKTSLRQSDSAESTRDGMDIALCSIDTVNRTLTYAGANRPIWIIRRGQTYLEETKATKKAIGGLTEDSQHFESHEIKFQQGDTFYIFSDGYADTFSGRDGKKLTSKKFKEILIGIQDKTMHEQERHLDDFIEDWKAGAEQVDDILVIGVRF
jgi:two-component system, sensor histidine kinase LadS